MAHQRMNDDLRGTEPARQTSDPAISERDSHDPVGPTSAVQDSGPGVAFALAFLAIFAVVLAGAILTGVIG